MRQFGYLQISYQVAWSTKHIFTSSNTKTTSGTPESTTQNPGFPRYTVWISQCWLVVFLTTYSVWMFLAMNQPYTVSGVWYKQVCQSTGKCSAICHRAVWYMLTHFSLLQNVGYLLNDRPLLLQYLECALCTVHYAPHHWLNLPHRPKVFVFSQLRAF